MKARVLSPVGFNAGAVLLLSKEQAVARQHALEPLGGARYRVATRVEFKAGEVIGFDGDPDKVTAAKLEPLGRREKPQPAGDGQKPAAE